MEDIIKPIVAPELETSNYGESINDQFVNIDNNFKLIANRDFVKGDSGKSLYIENIKITKDGEGIEGKLYEALKTAIEDRFSSNGALRDVGDYHWDDAVKFGELNTPIIASENKTTGVVEYICAASPVMLFDNRFNENAIENVDFSEYEDVVDVTSILNFKKDGENWVCELNLSYPRLQYKDGSFHWVINNVNTIVKSTGIKGDPGESANIWIVQTPVLPDAYSDTPINITKYFVGNEWIDEVPKNIKDGDLAIVYCESEEKDYYGFFVSQIKIDGANKTVVYNPKANIQNINYIKNTTEFFKSLGKGDAARGMFLKFDPDSSASTESHIFYNDVEKLYIKPTNDFSSAGNYTDTKQPSINISGYDTTNIISRTIELTGAVTVGEDLTVSKGGLTVSGETNLNRDLNADKNVNIKNNISFLSGSNENKHQIIVNGNPIYVTDSNGNNISTTTGTTDSELTVWASNIHLVGNKDNQSNIIILGNGGMNKSSYSDVDIQGDLHIKPAGKNKGDLTVFGGKIDMKGVTLTRQIDNLLTISGRGVEILDGGLTVGGNTDLQAGLQVSDELGVDGLTTLRGGLTVKGDTDLEARLRVSDELEVGGPTTLRGDLTVTSTITANKITAEEITADDITVSGSIGTVKISTQNPYFKNMWISIDEIADNKGKDTTNWKYLGICSNPHRYVYTPKHIVFGIIGAKEGNEIGENEIQVVFDANIFPPGHGIILQGDNYPDDTHIMNFEIWPIQDIPLAVGNCTIVCTSDSSVQVLNKYVRDLYNFAVI